VLEDRVTEDDVGLVRLEGEPASITNEIEDGKAKTTRNAVTDQGCLQVGIDDNRDCAGLCCGKTPNVPSGRLRLRRRNRALGTRATYERAGEEGSGCDDTGSHVWRLVPSGRNAVGPDASLAQRWLQDRRPVRFSWACAKAGWVASSASETRTGTPPTTG
jgi:hypothetical protein